MENQVVSFRSQDLTEVNIPTYIVVPSVPVDVLSKLVDIHNVLKREERAYYDEACKGGDLNVLYSSSVYNKSLTKLIEYGYLPLIYALKQKLENNRKKLNDLKQQQQQQQQQYQY